MKNTNSRTKDTNSRLMKRTVLYLIVGAVIVATVTGVAIWRSRAAGGPQEVRSAVVERGTMVVAVSASGSVEPQARVNLAFETAGRVAEVVVQVGDAVRVGEELARLDTRQLSLQVQQAEAAVALAEAQVAQLRAGARPEEIAAAEANLQAAEAQVGAAVANLDQLEAGPGEAQVATARANLASALSQQKVAQDTYDLVLTCVKFTLPNGEKQEICPALGAPEEQARFNLAAADKALAAAQAQLDQVTAGADADQVRAARANVEAAAAQRDAAQAQLDLLRAGATAEQIADAEAQVDQAQAALELSLLALEQATLRAPFDGVVAECNVKAGELASAGVPAITLLDTTRYHVTARVDETQAGRLAEGQMARVTLDALQNGAGEAAAIAGNVERIAPVARPEGGVVYYDVTIALAPAAASGGQQPAGIGPIRAGMTANVTIVVEQLDDVLQIPTWVVRVDRSTGQTFVNRRRGESRTTNQGSRIERVDVTLGVRYEGVAQVLGGLAEGDEVVLVPESASFGFSP